MLFLLFICMSTVVGVPINQTHGATSSAPEPDVQQAVTEALNGTVITFTYPLQQASAETVGEFQEDTVVTEGDILIPEDRNAVDTVWADATVPYTISPELADREENILKAFKMISAVTCIRFQNLTEELNYLIFLDGDGCKSFVGCQGGAQRLYYARSCSVGNLCHEIIHALGLHHEHTRKDRDQYISVLWDNIMPGMKKHFSMKRGNSLNLPYDLQSIMHYGPYFFSLDGSPTLVPKNDDVKLGQRTHLSTLDIQRLNRLYHCDERMKERESAGWRN